MSNIWFLIREAQFSPEEDLQVPKGRFIQNSTNWDDNRVKDISAKGANTTEEL